MGKKKLRFVEKYESFKEFNGNKDDLITLRKSKINDIIALIFFGWFVGIIVLIEWVIYFICKKKYYEEV